MRVVDTSAWIEWLAGTPLGQDIGRALPAAPDWVVPTIIQFELARWATREGQPGQAERIIAFTTTCVVVPLSSAIALSAADMCAEHRLAMADAIIYATARLHGADLLTCDRHFAALPHVDYRPKRR